MKLVAELENRGGVDGERSIIYGGDIPDRCPKRLRWMMMEIHYLPECKNMAKLNGENDRKGDLRLYGN